MTNGDPEHSLPREVLEAELDAICKRRCAVGLFSDTSLENRLVGLALSGGGIRSATFALGVLQRLAQADVLKRFDYLSTVSGGGYIGGSLTWLLSRTTRHDATGAMFPYGVRKHRLGWKESNILRHLRLHGKYLTPGRGITAMSLAAVILRGIVLNLVVWLPLAVLFFCGLYLLTERIGADAVGGGYLAYLVALAVVGMAFLVVNVLYSLATWRPILPQPYLWRRRFERHVRWLLWVGLTLAGFGSLPLVSGWLQGYGAASLLAGLAGGLLSFGRSGGGDGGSKIPIEVLAPAASFLVLYGLALVSYDLSGWYLQADSPRANWLLAVATAVSVVAGFMVNLNYISIHRYYRDRLMEAFMPHPNTDGTTAAAVDADRAKLSEMCVENGPYHLVNTNVVLVDADDQRWRVRGGDSFVLSPKYCGGTATNWVKTADYMQRDPLTLPTAIAISGAAANPNTGVGGAGPTRRPGLSLLMGLLNVRLGYWVPHPAARRQPVANHFRAAWHELSQHGYAENRKLLQLSDGGHFENLGVYELVRRRVKVIVSCDAGADPGFDFADLQVLMRRIGADFGARVEFEHDNQIERLIPRDPDPRMVQARDPDTDAYPVGARFAERGYVRGVIVYPDESRSTLILLKTAMIPGLGLLLRGYKGANRDFPDQTTADQFFDEEQFEAYRELGYEIADTLINDPNIALRDLLRQCTEPAGDGQDRP